MPTFLLFKDGKKVEGKEIRGADVRGLKGVVEGVVKDLKAGEKGGEKKEKVPAPAAEVDVGEKPSFGFGSGKRADVAVEEETVSGSYGMNKNSSWKMSLH